MSENNVQIIGAGVVGAGDFEKITINGTGNIKGEITAKSLNVNGVAKACENITAEKVEINGTFSGRNIKGKKIVIRGIADFNGKVECEQFELNGSIRCDSINSEQIEIKLKGFGNVNELVGSHINVKVNEPTLIIMSVQIKPSVLKAKMIEADEIYLEHTEADVVSGNIVQIGRGCKIGRVEYRESLKVSDSAGVEQIVKE